MVFIFLSGLAVKFWSGAGTEATAGSHHVTAWLQVPYDLVGSCPV